MNETTIVEMYARLTALKANVPSERYYADQRYIEEFHRILDSLQSVSGYNLANFRVADSEVELETTGGNTLTGETYYSGRKVCERSYLMMKIDGLLGFFTLRQGSQKTSIGFNPAPSGGNA